MRLQRCIGTTFAVVLALTACAGGPHSTSPPAPTAPVVRAESNPEVAKADFVAPPAALRLEGVPPLPRALIERAQRYDRVSGHSFVDWHPSRREMLVAHRAPEASTVQLYRLRAPQAPLEPLTDGPDPVRSANWEPRSGRYIVFARASGGDEAYQLYRLDPGTRDTVRLTEPTQRHTLMGWVKSRSLAIVASVPLDRTAPEGRRSEISTRLSLLDPLQPAAKRLLAELPGGGWFGAEVSPDEKQLAVTRYVSAAESEIWLLDLASGQRRRILPAAGEPLWASHFAGHWSRDGQALVLTSDRAGEFRELMRLDLPRNRLTRLSRQIPWDVSWSGASPDGRTTAMLVNADGRGELRLLDTASGAPQPLPALPAGNLARAEFHASRAELALVTNSPQAPSQIHSLDLTTQALTAWTTPPGAEGLNLHTLPEQRIVRWTSFDGRSISGILSPPPLRFSGPRPVLMLMHGGPEAQARPGWNGRLNLLVEELGVALLEPNVRGSSGYGKTFLSLDNGRRREDAVRDMAAALDWIASQPGLDASRVLVMGGSYGGYLALAAATQLGDRIAGAVSVVGISNFVSFLENTESYRRDLRRVEYGDERDPAMREFLHRISPLSHVQRIRRPLMVVQGRNDPRVPWTESEQIVRGLQARGTPVWYLLADNEGHGFVRRENASHYFAALVKFVESTLLP